MKSRLFYMNVNKVGARCIRTCFIAAKQLEENEQDESSDSSDEGEFDDADEVPMSQGKPKSATLPAVLGDNRVRFGYTNDTRNGPQRKLTQRRVLSTRRTKQKGYWSNFLKGVFEK